MKILIVTPKYYPDTFPINLVAEELVQKGHDVHVLTSVPFINGQYIKKYDKSCTIENGVTVYRVKTSIRTNSKKSLIKYYLSLTRNMMKWAKYTSNLYEVVYTYSISPMTILGAGNLYKKKYGIIAKLNEDGKDTGTVNTFIDDIVGAIAASAASRFAHRWVK